METGLTSSGGTRRLRLPRQQLQPAHDDTHDPQEDQGALLAAIVRDSNDAIISKRIDGTITSWNLGAERLFGFAPAEAIGQNITLIIPAQRLPEEQTILRKIREIGRASCRER